MVQIVPQGAPGPRLGEALLGSGKDSLGDILKAYELKQKYKKQEGELEAILEAGLPPELAALYARVPTGAKTSIIQKGLELLERQEGMPRETLGLPMEPEEEVREEVFEEEIKPPVPTDVGLTEKERVKREEGRYGKNIEEITTAENKVNSLEQELLSLEQLDMLNATGALPKGLGRINVNLKTGELRLPFAASEEAQLFSKTINDFTTKAKDSFGARVTNFELNRFMKRLPSLLNTEEGRTAIVRQMGIINRLNQLHHQGLVEAFDKAGGARKIDLDKARSYANKITKKEKNRLIQEYKGIDKVLKKVGKEEKLYTMETPDGKRVRVPKNRLLEAQQAGGKLIR